MRYVSIHINPDRYVLIRINTDLSVLIRIFLNAYIPVLGTLINFTGMRRIWTRGIKAANKFILGAAIAYNLKKLMKFKEKTVKVIPMMVALPKNEEQSLKKLWFLLLKPYQPSFSTTS